MDTPNEYPKCLDCKHFDAVGFTCGLAESSDGSPMYKDTLAYASDTDGYHACLLVQPDFGCVSWKEKE